MVYISKKTIIISIIVLLLSLITIETYGIKNNIDNMKPSIIIRSYVDYILNLIIDCIQYIITILEKIKIIMSDIALTFARILTILYNIFDNIIDIKMVSEAIQNIYMALFPLIIPLFVFLTYYILFNFY